MIATGGLLRITARRQDSLPKTRIAHKNKKSQQKSRTEVVVVKGKLKLISVSGLVASLGFLVLLVGMAMAALGYWPRDGLFFKSPAQEGAALDSVGATSQTAGPQKRDAASQPEGGRSHGGTVNGTAQQQPSGFLKDLLYRYLHSDRLKVLGPLVMGVGIFLFICGNAVLHENRDRKTKVIDLRDIYSTVIDLQRGHKPGSPSARPLNGLVNYVQSKSLESKSRYCPPFLMKRGAGEGGGGQRRGPDSGRGGDGGAGVTSIYPPPAATPPPSGPDLRPGPSSACWTSMCASPPGPSRSPAPWRRHSARGGGATGGAGEAGHVEGRGGGGTFAGLHLEAPGGSRALLLSAPLAPPGSSPPPDSHSRRCSLPTITCWEGAAMQSSHQVRPHL